MSYLQHGDRKWHAECFKCNVCRACGEWRIPRDGQQSLVQNMLSLKDVPEMRGLQPTNFREGYQICAQVVPHRLFRVYGCRKPLVVKAKRSKIRTATLLPELHRPDVQKVLQVQRSDKHTSHRVQGPLLPSAVFPVQQVRQEHWKWGVL